MRQAEGDRLELQAAQQRAEDARRIAEEAAHLEKTERETKVGLILSQVLLHCRYVCHCSCMWIGKEEHVRLTPHLRDSQPEGERLEL